MKKTFIKQMGLLTAGAICLTMLFIPGMKARATDASGDFEINGSELTRYTGSDTEVVIPGGVTSIGEGAFSETGITSVTIPEGVGSIGAYAFHGCGSLSQVNIPASTNSIDMSAFSGCVSLENVSIAGGNGTYSSSDGCVYNAAGNRLLYVPAAKDSFTPRSGLTVIGAGAFADATVEIVRLPEGVTTIESGAFGNAPAQVLIPKSVTEIGPQANWNPKDVAVYMNSAAYNILKDEDAYDLPLNIIPENNGGNSGDNNNPNGGNSGDNNDPNGGNSGDNNNPNGGNNGGNNSNNGGNGDSNSNNGNNGSSGNNGSNSGSSNSAANGGTGSSGGDNLTKATGSSHVKDDTPTTGDRIDPKYFLFAGVLLIGVYLLISKRNVKDEKKDDKE